MAVVGRFVWPSAADRIFLNLHYKSYLFLPMKSVDRSESNKKPKEEKEIEKPLRITGEPTRI